jgi:DNA-3-methyladenine glycosylase
MPRPKEIRRLRRNELPTNTVELARYLIGKTLVHDLPQGRISGRIVETEAYLPDDAACHAFRGPTPRNRALFLERGHAYVYFIYGTTFMLNVSSQPAGIGAGILFRAVEPLQGIELMQQRRPQAKLPELTRGPGRLATAFWIDRNQDGLDLCAGGPLWLGAAVKRAGRIGVSVRIGITQDAHRLLRFYEEGSPFVSGPQSLNTPLPPARARSRTTIATITGSTAKVRSIATSGLPTVAGSGEASTIKRPARQRTR